MKDKKEIYDMKEVVAYFSNIYKGNWEKIYSAIKNNEIFKMEDFENFVKNNDLSNFISIIDDDYPENFKSIYMPPLVLYFNGNKDILKNTNNSCGLFGEVNEKNFNNLIKNKDSKTFILNYSDEAIKIAKNNPDLEFVLVSDEPYSKKINTPKNVFHLTELPENSTKDEVLDFDYYSKKEQNPLERDTFFKRAAFGLAKEINYISQETKIELDQTEELKSLKCFSTIENKDINFISINQQESKPNSQSRGGQR